MTREIKFRAWDDKGKFWYPAETMIDFFNFRSEEFTIIADQFNKEAISLEQYTGLKDKNGKEIYEGDIIESTWNGDKAEVIWNDVEGEWEHYADFNTHSKYSGSVVIGNIHENPDLLK